MYASAMALEAFLDKGRKAGALQAGQQLCAATLQQVQQSGLLQHLADMMTKTADQLAQATAAACAVQTPDSLPKGNEAAGVSSSTSSSSSSRVHNTSKGISSLKQHR